MSLLVNDTNGLYNTRSYSDFNLNIARPNPIPGPDLFSYVGPYLGNLPGKLYYKVRTVYTVSKYD